MGTDAAAPRSRRALLTAAAGAAGALAAQAALPLAAAAADPDDLVLGVADQATTAETGIAQSTDAVVAFRVHNQTQGAAALVATNGDTTNAETDTSYTAAYAWTPYATDQLYGTAVWGDSEDIGVYGSGSYGVVGYGGIGVEGDANGLTGSIGVRAWAPSTSQVALRVDGKVVFSRSGRQSVASGKKSYSKAVAGMTSSSKVFAVFATNESGRYIRAVVPASGKFTVYFNTALSSSAVFSWFVLD